ncbi:MAG TPA: hypothetical protein VFJ17_11440 [Mycobacteriales bacterium]|jgi:hypothetical protein|nr:hypothetical protein [Mycobacteriales bacterium]
MSAHRLLGLVVAFMATATVVGCGGGSSTGQPGSATRSAAGHDAFLRQVDAVCQQAVRAHAGHPFPVLGFDPEHPDPAKLPAVGDYFARYGGLPTTVQGLHRLTPPVDEAAAWRALLVVADQMSANAQRQVTAARARDTATFVQTVKATTALVTHLNSAGSNFGFTSNSPCSQVFG